MNRLERITAILLTLQSRRKVTAQQLADHFDTSIRTIYRDVRVLEEAGVPIGAEAGLGYYIMDGYSLPPVMFSKEEAAAMLTGEKLLEKLGDVSVNREIKAAMKKVRAVLRSSEKDFLETLDESMIVHSRRPAPADGFPNRFISDIQQALVQQQIVEIEYVSSYKDEITKREIEPIGLCFINGAWHLFAHCRMRNDVRDFRPDRIRQLRLLEGHYNKSRHPPLQTHIDKWFTAGEHIRVVVNFDNSIARFGRDMKYYYGLVDEADKGSHTESVFLVPSVAQFARWLTMWGTCVQVVEPDTLKKELSQFSRELYEHYQ